MAHNNRKYHIEMMLNELQKFKFPNKGDTRNYLSIDEDEAKILSDMLKFELDKA